MNKIERETKEQETEMKERQGRQNQTLPRNARTRKQKQKTHILNARSSGLDGQVALQTSCASAKSRIAATKKG